MEGIEESLFHRSEITFDLNILKKQIVFRYEPISLAVLRRPRFNGELWKGHAALLCDSPSCVEGGGRFCPSFLCLSFKNHESSIHTNFGGMRPMSQPTNDLVLVHLKVIFQISEIFLHPGFSTLNINVVS